MNVIVVANLKGGSGKTITAAYLAHALQERDRYVLAVDADPQRSLEHWQALAGWPTVPVVSMPSTTLHRQLDGVADPDRFDTVVVDTPPWAERAGIVESALRVATVALVTMAPTSVELANIDPVWNAITAAGLSDRAAVLLNRCVANASSTGKVRAALTMKGLTVFAAQIPRWEAYAQSFGATVQYGDIPYGEAADELIDWGWLA